MNQASNKTILV